MPVDVIIFVAALVVAWLVFNWLIQVVKASMKTAITVAVIVLILQLFLGIGPQDLWEQIIDLPQTIYQLIAS